MKRNKENRILPEKKPLSMRLVRDFKMNKWKYLLMLPILIYFILFCYKPMYGIVIAFKDYSPHKTIAESEWVGFRFFVEFFKDPYFFRVLLNTVRISAFSILFGFPAPILFALLLNEMRRPFFKKVVQTVTYLPHFISMVVICGLIKTFTLNNGIVNTFITAFGGTSANLLQKSEAFIPIYILSDIWQGVGWGSIIYLAAISGIDQEQYDSARIDGANRFQQMFRITLPNIMPTIIILFIMRMGSILNVGFEKILLLYGPQTYKVADVISTYVYRLGMESARYSYSTAVGLFNSIINVMFLIITNFICKKLNSTSLF